MRYLISVIFLCVVVGLTIFIYPRQEMSSERQTNIEELINALMEEAAIPGIAIAKVEQGEIAYIATRGFADIERNKPVTESTLFNIASVSKPIMGVALLKLADQQMLDLDADINNYLSFKVDNPNLDDEIITLRHLASHSGSLDDYYDTESYSSNADSPVSLNEHLKSLLSTDGKNYQQGEHYLDQAPGSYRKYSNLGAGLAGHVVEAVTGQTLADFSKSELFPLLGMPTSSWLLNDLQLSNIAVPYEVEQCIPWLFVCADTENVELNYVISKFIKPPRSYKSYIPYPHFGNPQYPDGGVRANIEDLSHFLKHLLLNVDANGQALLSDAMYNEMFSLQLDPQVSDSQRFFWRDMNGLTGHMGSDLGVFTSLYFDINSRTGFVIVMNRGMDSNAARAMTKIAENLMTTKFL